LKPLKSIYATVIVFFICISYDNDMRTQENGRYFDEDIDDKSEKKNNQRFLSSSQDRSRQLQQKTQLVRCSICQFFENVYVIV